MARTVLPVVVWEAAAAIMAAIAMNFVRVGLLRPYLNLGTPR